MLTVYRYEYMNDANWHGRNNALEEEMDIAYWLYMFICLSSDILTGMPHNNDIDWLDCFPIINVIAPRLKA
jgi:hypothetical protein